MFERVRQLLGKNTAAEPKPTGSILNLGNPVATVGAWYVPDVKDRYFLQSGLDISPEQIQLWVRLAESGETRFLHAFYEEAYARESHIRSEINKQIALVCGARRDVLPTPMSLRKKTLRDSADAKIAQDAVAYVESQIYHPRVRLNRALGHLTKARHFGVAVCSVESQPGEGPDGKELLTALRPVPPQRIRVNVTTSEYEVNVGNDTWVRLDDLVAMGFAIALKFDEEMPSPARRGLMRAMIPHFIVRTTTPLSWGRYVELFGMPIRTAEVPQDDVQLRDQTEQAMENQGAAGFFTLPVGVKMQLLEAAKGDAPHERFLEASAKEISKLVHGSTQHADIQKGAGSKQSADSHVDVMYLTAQEVANEVAGVVMQQLFEGLVRRNFSDDVAKEHTPEFRLLVAGVKDLKEFADGVGGLKTAGLKIGTDWVYDQAQIPIPDEDDEVLGDGVPQALPGLPGQVLPFPGAPGAPGVSGAPPRPRPPSPKPGPGDGTGDARALAERVVALLGAGNRLPANPANEVLSDLEAQAAEAAWDAGRELLVPYADLLKRAAEESWPMPQLLSRILHRYYGRPGANRAHLTDLLAATIAEASLRGIEEVRKSRGA